MKLDSEICTAIIVIGFSNVSVSNSNFKYVGGSFKLVFQKLILSKIILILCNTSHMVNFDVN